MNRVARLRIDSTRRITFILGEITVVKMFKGKEHITFKLNHELAIKLYKEFLRRGAQTIL